MRGYRLNAHGYEMVVSRDINGDWIGACYRVGHSASVPVTAGPGQLDDIKLEVCRQVEALAIVHGRVVVDSCEESLSLWSEIPD